MCIILVWTFMSINEKCIKRPLKIPEALSAVYNFFDGMKVVSFK